MMKILLLFDPSRQGSGGAIRVTRLRRAAMRLGFQPLCLSLDRCDSLTRTLEAMAPPDLVFSSVATLQLAPKEELDIHAFLEQIGVPYVGSSSEVLQGVLSKVSLKEKWNQDKVPTPWFWPVRHQADLESLLSQLDQERMPLIIKPIAEGNSRGITEDSVVFDKDQLRSRGEQSLARFGEVIVEQFLGHAGGLREFTVAMIGNGSNALIMPAELVLNREYRNRVITTRDKQEGTVEARTIEDLALREQVSELATRAFDVAGVRDYARCDILMAGDQLYALEVNGQPMVPDSWFGACARGEGLSETQYLGCLLLSSIQRYRSNLAPSLTPPALVRHILPDDIFQRLTRDPSGRE